MQLSDVQECKLIGMLDTLQTSKYTGLCLGKIAPRLLLGRVAHQAQGVKDMLAGCRVALQCQHKPMSVPSAHCCNSHA